MRLHHQGLAGDEVEVYPSVLQVLGVGNALHVPAGQEVGSGNGKGHLSLLVGTQVGEEEGGVAQVFAQIGLLRLWLGGL